MISHIPLKELFPILFQVSLQKDVKVEEIRLKTIGGMIWEFRWGRIFFILEKILFLEIFKFLEGTFIPRERSMMTNS